MYWNLCILLNQRTSVIKKCILKHRKFCSSLSLDHKIQKFLEDEAKGVFQHQCNELRSNPTVKVLQKSLKYAKQVAGVLVPICIVDGRPSILYTVRSQNLTNHRGEISFPGGIKHDEDLSIEDTALRETEEELSISRNSVEIFSSTGPFVNKAGTIAITAVFGYVGKLRLSDLLLSEKEVSEAFTVPIANLQHHRDSRYTLFKNGWRLPVFISRPYHIWGITASMTDAALSMITPIKYSQKFSFVRHDIQNSFVKNKPQNYT